MAKKLYIPFIILLITSCSKDPQFVNISKTQNLLLNISNDEMIDIIINGEGVVKTNLISINEGEYTYKLSSRPNPGWDFVKWEYREQEFYTTEFTLSTKEKTNITIDFVNTKDGFNYEKEVLIELSNQIIWGLDTHEEKMVFTTKNGDIFLYTDQTLTNLHNPIKNEINPNGQGGLLDIKFHPNFKKNGIVYIVYTETLSGSDYSYLVLSQFILKNEEISDIKTIFRTNSISSRSGHFGSRIAFSSDHIFLSIGEGSESVGGSNSPFKNAQNLDNDWGKIHKINFDGTIPTDNPFNARSIYTYGHRNPQGLVFNPYTKELISTEHGPQGGDEINIIEEGKNYGWPLVSYGINYDGSDISGKSHAGYKEPIKFWDPSIATSQIILLNDKNHKAWFKNYLVCGLRSKAIHRMGYSDGKLQEFEVISLGDRIRSISNGKDGVFFVSTDTGKIIKFYPIEIN